MREEVYLFTDHSLVDLVRIAAACDGEIGVRAGLEEAVGRSVTMEKQHSGHYVSQLFLGL